MPPFRIRSTALGLSSLLAIVGNDALAMPMAKPGQYAYSVSIKMMGMTMPAVNFQKCVTQKDIDDGKAYVNTNAQTDCSDTKVNWSGNDFTVNSACKNPERTMTGQGHVTDSGMTMTMDVVMGGSMPMMQQQTITAQRTGDCSK